MKVIVVSICSMCITDKLKVQWLIYFGTILGNKDIVVEMRVHELSHKLKASAVLQVNLISKHTEVTEALEALVSNMATTSCTNNMIRTRTYHLCSEKKIFFAVK